MPARVREWRNIRSLLWYTHTHTFNGPFFGTTRVSRYQKGKTNLDFTEARDSEWQWQWHQLGHMQVCTLLQTDNHASTPPLECPSCRLTYSVKALKADTCSISITPAHCSAPASRPPAHRIFGPFRSDFYSTQWCQEGWQERSVSRRVECDCKPHALLACRDHQQKILKQCVMPSQYAQDPAA